MTDNTNDGSAPSMGHGGVRVSLNLLDTLMNLAGELVLSRNQLLQMVNEEDLKGISASSQRIDLITSELQDAIMKIRMQPVDNLLNDLADRAGSWNATVRNGLKIQIQSNQVELDRSILEALRHPLEGLLRHLVELRDASPGRTSGDADAILLTADQDAGQVYITLMDRKSFIDAGKGIDAPDIADHIDSLGGSLDIRSDTDTGTRIRIKLPLTLAIIPSQIAAVGPERYALPQANLDELLRIPAAQVKEKIEKVGDAAVVRLRGELLPVLDLATLLGLQRQYPDPDTGEFLPERRENIADRRSRQLLQKQEDGHLPPGEEDRRAVAFQDRRRHRNSAVQIAVVSAGTYRYGLVVDRFLDVEEIVVKSLGRHMRSCTAYAGATIMGDGTVALILDIASLAKHAQLSETLHSLSGISTAADETETADRQDAMILFRNREEEYFCAPQQYVDRIERVRSDRIEALGSKRVIQHQGRTLPLFALNEVADVGAPPLRETQEILVIRDQDKEFGLMITPPVDTVDRISTLDDSALKGRAIKGSTIINGRTTLVLDMEALIREIP